MQIYLNDLAAKSCDIDEDTLRGKSQRIYGIDTNYWFCISSNTRFNLVHRTKHCLELNLTDGHFNKRFLRIYNYSGYLDTAKKLFLKL